LREARWRLSRGVRFVPAHTSSNLQADYPLPSFFQTLLPLTVNVDPLAPGLAAPRLLDALPDARLLRSRPATAYRARGFKHTVLHQCMHDTRVVGHTAGRTRPTQGRTQELPSHPSNRPPQAGSRIGPPAHLRRGCGVLATGIKHLNQPHVADDSSHCAVLAAEQLHLCRGGTRGGRGQGARRWPGAHARTFNCTSVARIMDLAMAQVLPCSRVACGLVNRSSSLASCNHALRVVPWGWR
jgi:hypothetical protein